MKRFPAGALFILLPAVSGAGLPDFLSERMQDGPVLAVPAQEGGVLNPELTGVPFWEREDGGASELPGNQMTEAESRKQEKEDLSLPPLPVIGKPLSEVEEKTVTVIESEPHRAPVLSGGDSSMTVIEGRYVRERSADGKSRRVTVSRDSDYPWTFSFSLDVPPEMLRDLQYRALDLAMEAGKTERPDFSALRVRLEGLMQQKGFILPLVEISGEPRVSGSQLVMISMYGARIHRVILSNYTDLPDSEIRERFTELVPGNFLIRGDLEAPLNRFNRAMRGQAQAVSLIRASGIRGRADLHIRIRKPDRAASSAAEE